MVTERNTFGTSAYIETTPESAYEYLAELKNLGEWTLYSRMEEQCPRCIRQPCSASRINLSSNRQPR
ncbi:MAG: hypothetical protein F6K28_04305 [Microcoleus sp. SIO2G3]|nr:hypothetical protein [Microcoleus sp. SIO2G3]